MELSDLSNLFEEKETLPNCKGRVYKCLISCYIMKDGSFVNQTKMRLMKRLSCSGCDQCGWFEEALYECLPDYPPITDDPMHNALYKLGVTNEIRDWETGYVDNFDLIFNRIDE